jgi:hypothetical protein
MNKKTSKYKTTGGKRKGLMGGGAAKKTKYKATGGMRRGMKKGGKAKK